MLLKDEIVHESMKLFSLKGYANTGVDEIIRTVGSSKGGFYNHFASKEDLFYEVLAKAQKMWRERVLNGLDEVENPVDKVIKLLQNYRERYLLDGENFPGGCIFVTFSVELDHQQPQLIREVNKGFVRLKNMLERLLEEGKKTGKINEDVDPVMMSELIFAGMLGASVMFGVEKSPESLNKTIQSLIDIINKSRQKK